MHPRRLWNEKKTLKEEKIGPVPSKMAHLRYTHSGKVWKPSPTEGKGDCFFHSVFGIRNGDGLYYDKYAKFRRMYWSAFLTYRSFGDLTGALLELLKKCFVANDSYQQKCVENPDNYVSYASDVTDAGYWVLVEEIPILVTLENIRVILFIHDRDEPVVFAPDSKLLGNFPFRSINVVREVVICLVDGHFSRLNPYDEPISNEATALVHKFTSTKKQDANGTSPKLNRKKHYVKLAGSAGIKGGLYQIDLLTMVLLNGMRKVKNWRLSTENKDAPQLDDLIFEYLPSESTILVQAKQKEDERRHEVTYYDLTSVNLKSEFSLPKYFISYEEVKNRFKVQNVVICTNLGFDEETKSMLNEESVDSDSVLHFEGAENICYGFNGCSLPKLKQNIRTAYVKKKKVTVCDADIDEFLRRLKFFPNCLDRKNVDKILEETLNSMKCSKNSKMIQDDIRKRMTDWFKKKKGRYLTELEAKAFFCDVRSNKYCEDLKLYDIRFKNNNLPLILQTNEKSGRQNNSNAPVKDPKRLSHIIPDKEYILNVVKIHQVLAEAFISNAFYSG